MAATAATAVVPREELIVADQAVAEAEVQAAGQAVAAEVATSGQVVVAAAARPAFLFLLGRAAEADLNSLGLICVPSALQASFAGP